MPRPFLLAQLSDPHIGADWFDDRSVPRLAAAAESVRAFRPRPDAVLLTGDIADHATDEEYEQVRELLAPLGPLHVLPGNHDDRRGLHRNFGVPGGDGESVRCSVELGPLRLVALDTTIPGGRPRRRLACGHVHRTLTGELAGRSVMVAPSTYVQMRPNFLSDELDLTAEPAGFALHAVVDGELVSHVQTVQ